MPNVRLSVKIVVIDTSKISRPIVGVSIVGEHAGDMMSEAALLVQNNGTLFAPSVIDTVHPHPTLPEVIVEAVRVAVGEPLHALPRSKK